MHNAVERLHGVRKPAGWAPLKAARGGFAGGKKRIKSYVPPPAGERRGGKRESQSQSRITVSHQAGKQEGSSTAMSLAGYTGAESSESEEGEGMDLAALN